MHSHQTVYLQQVVPALVARLPLKEDMEENKTVFNCLTMLYKNNPAMVQTPFIHLHL